MRNKQFLKMTILKKDLQYYAVYNVGVYFTRVDFLSYFYVNCLLFLAFLAKFDFLKMYASKFIEL